MDAREREAHARRGALEDIERAGAQSEIFGTSALRRQAERARAHFAGEDADQEDAIEVWGRRIGRTLSVIGIVALAVYLAMNHS